MMQLRPKCFLSDVSWSAWLEAAQATGTLNPCADCTARYAQMMARQGRCVNRNRDGLPSVRDLRVRLVARPAEG